MMSQEWTEMRSSIRRTAAWPDFNQVCQAGLNLRPSLQMHEQALCQLQDVALMSLENAIPSPVPICGCCFDASKHAL